MPTGRDDVRSRGEDRKSPASGRIDAIDPYETWVEEPTRQHSVVIWDNMYFLDLAANRRVERH
jgi:hypothetical protein